MALDPEKQARAAELNQLLRQTGSDELRAPQRQAALD